MADDALTRKEAEMKLTSDSISYWTYADARTDFERKIGNMALTYLDDHSRALSLESVREEADTRIRIAELNALAARSAALEEAAKVCESNSYGWPCQNELRNRAAAIRALQHAPARVAEGRPTLDKMVDRFLSQFNNRFGIAQPIQFTDNERQVLVIALRKLGEVLAAAAEAEGRKP